MSTEIICTFITTVGVIIVALFQYRADKDKKEREKVAKLRARESRLSMEMMYATLQLSIVTANALTGGHNNGNVEEAKKAAADAQKAYEAFLRDTAAEQVGTEL